jgi:hypothetical protein
MRFSARRALEEGSINPEKYSQILARAERIEKQKITLDARELGKVRDDLLKLLAK